MKTKQTKQKEKSVERYQAPVVEVIRIELQKNMFGSAPDIPGEGA